MIVRGSESSTIRSIRTDGEVLLRSVEYSLRIVYCISLGRLKKRNVSYDCEVFRGPNDPFDPYGSNDPLTHMASCGLVRIFSLPNEMQHTTRKLYSTDRKGP